MLCHCGSRCYDPACFFRIDGGSWVPVAKSDGLVPLPPPPKPDRGNGEAAGFRHRSGVSTQRGAAFQGFGVPCGADLLPVQRTSPCLYSVSRAVSLAAASCVGAHSPVARAIGLLLGVAADGPTPQPWERAHCRTLRVTLALLAACQVHAILLQATHVIIP